MVTGAILEARVIRLWMIFLIYSCIFSTKSIYYFYNSQAMKTRKKKCEDSHLTSPT